MYRLFSAQDIMNNVLALVSPYIDDINQLNTATLKLAYRKYLENLQPYCPYMNSSQLFYADVEVEEAFADYFTPEIRVPESEMPYEPEILLYPDAKKRQAALEKGLEQLHYLDSTFAELFSLIMNTVFCTITKRLGGTSVNPSYVGVMCAYYDMTAEEKAIPELFIHEFTHNALFLDEHRYGHYKDIKKLEDPNTYINSIYRGIPIKLPFDRALHSLIVSAEVIMARDNYIGHQPRISQHFTTNKIIERANDYIAQIKANLHISNLMTDRCQEIFNKCAVFFAKRNYV